MINANLLNGANLSYLGDAYYELYIRRYLIEKGITSQNKLHQESVKYVSAEAHYKIIERIVEELSKEELEIYKRGRNSKSCSRRKNLDILKHNESSGYEALIGYLYLNGKMERLEEILKKSIEIVEE